MRARYRYILVPALLVTLLITGIAYFAINSGEEPTDLPADQAQINDQMPDEPQLSKKEQRKRMIEETKKRKLSEKNKRA